MKNGSVFVNAFTSIQLGGAKARSWYLICRQFTKPFGRIASSIYTATVRVAPSFIPELSRYFGNHIHTKIAQAGPPDAEGWIRLELSFESFEAARERILGFGRGVEVLEPRALRRSVLDYAEQIIALYTH